MYATVNITQRAISCEYLCYNLSLSLCLCLSLSLSLSLRFNGQFPGEPGLAGVYWNKGWWKWWWQLDYWSYKSCKAPVKSSPPTNQHPVFYRPDALPVAQPIVSRHWRGKISQSVDLLTPSSPGGLPTWSLTTKGSWLPWGRVAMPLISTLLPVPHLCYNPDILKEWPWLVRLFNDQTLVANDGNRRNEKSAQRDANTARWLQNLCTQFQVIVVTDPQTHKPTDRTDCNTLCR